MFKIHDDKVYFVAETPNINKVIEIFLPKDDRGTIMDSHEIRVDLCRAVIHMEKKGVRVLKVRNIEDTNKASIIRSSGCRGNRTTNTPRTKL